VAIPQGKIDRWLNVTFFSDAYPYTDTFIWLYTAIQIVADLLLESSLE
jgi:hypothetical protein